MTVRLLTEHYLEFLSLKGGCTGSSESTLVKKPHYWKKHVTAHIVRKGLFSVKHLIFGASKFGDFKSETTQMCRLSEPALLAYKISNIFSSCMSWSK